MYYLMMFLVFLLGLIAFQSVIETREHKAIEALNAWCVKFAGYFTSVVDGTNYLKMNPFTLEILRDYFPIRPFAESSVKFEMAHNYDSTIGILISDEILPLDVHKIASVYPIGIKQGLQRGEYDSQKIYSARDISIFRADWHSMAKGNGFDYDPAFKGHIPAGYDSEGRKIIEIV